MEWFLYDNGLRHERVKSVFQFYLNNITEWIKQSWNSTYNIKNAKRKGRQKDKETNIDLESR